MFKNKGWSGGKVFLGLMIIGALFVVSSQAQPPQELSLQRAVYEGFVKLESKGCYFGDCVTFIATGYADQEYIVTVRPGDILLNKNDSEQNLLITKFDFIRIGPGEYFEKWGLFTACIDAHKSGPSLDRVMDIGPNLYNWGGEYEEVAQELLRVLEVINKEGLWEDGSAQGAIWNITDDSWDEEVFWILEVAGVDPYESHGFPRLADPNAYSDDSDFAIPDEIHEIIDDYFESIFPFAPPDECAEPNDSFEDACFITLPFMGYFEIDPGGDRDFLAFEVSVGTMVIIDVDAQATGSGLDSYLNLYDEAGHLIASDDDTHGRDPYLEVSLHSSGIYYIEVRACGDHSTGPYTLRVEAMGHH